METNLFVLLYFLKMMKSYINVLAKTYFIYLIHSRHKKQTFFFNTKSTLLPPFNRQNLFVLSFFSLTFFDFYMKRFFVLTKRFHYFCLFFHLIKYVRKSLEDNTLMVTVDEVTNSNNVFTNK